MSYKSPLFTEDQLEVMKATGQLPILLTTRQVAAVLGVKPHDIRAFVRAGALTPLAFPLTEADGYFWRADVLALGENKNPCVKARKEMNRTWKKGNERDTHGDAD